MINNLLTLFTDKKTKAEELFRGNYPTLIKRVQSLFIDQLFIVLCMILFSQLFSFIDAAGTGLIRGIGLFGLCFIYEPFCIAFGCTLGNYIIGIRVKKFNAETKRINILSSYVRFTVKLFLGIISFFTVTSNQNKRAIHDLASGSVMLYVQRRT